MFRPRTRPETSLYYTTFWQKHCTLKDREAAPGYHQKLNPYKTYQLASAVATPAIVYSSLESWTTVSNGRQRSEAAIFLQSGYSRSAPGRRTTFVDVRALPWIR